MKTLKIVEKTGGTTENQAGGHSAGATSCSSGGRTASRAIGWCWSSRSQRRANTRSEANLTKAVDYGIVTLAVNDGEPMEFDRFNHGVVSDKLSLGTASLKAGTNRLTVTIKGANEKAVKRYMFGLDYLLLVPKS